MTATFDWYLECSRCAATRQADGLPTVCPACAKPWLVRYRGRTPTTAERDRPPGSGLWRWPSFLPIMPGEDPVTLGEGSTPLLVTPRLGETLGLPRLLVKDEGTNPTGSFKARGLCAAIHRARLGGATAFTLPTAGNAGVAAAAYGARAGIPVRVYAPRTTPKPILTQIAAFGADLQLLDGHIGDCGKASRSYASESGAMDLSTLREPYRIEGKKTMGLELAEQLGWRLPTVILYPTGGGTGLIGMWKVFGELAAAGWITGPLPQMVSVQSTGCAPVVEALARGADECTPWPDPWTVASGLRVPGPLGDSLMLRAIRESGGTAIAIDDPDLTAAASLGTSTEGIDFSPEGGAALAAARRLAAAGRIGPNDEVVVFNTGAGWLYR
ncbi:MAG: threonine synthase [Gemmatimonadetes bacterium]|nr:threonine synthase [Gemmatimonadota bacterium]